MKNSLNEVEWVELKAQNEARQKKARAAAFVMITFMVAYWFFEKSIFVGIVGLAVIALATLNFLFDRMSHEKYGMVFNKWKGLNADWESSSDNKSMLYKLHASNIVGIGIGVWILVIAVLSYMRHGV